MEQIANSETNAKPIPTKISGIGNTKTPVLICVERDGKVTATEVEIWKFDIWADECREGPPSPYYASVSFVDDEIVTADVRLFNGEVMGVRGDKGLTRRCYFEPEDLVFLRSAVCDMLIECAEGMHRG